MCGEDDDDLFAYFAEQIIETVAFFRIQASGGLVYNDNLRAAEQCLCNAKSLTHTAGKAMHLFVALFIQIHFLQQRKNLFFAFVFINAF